MGSFLTPILLPWQKEDNLNLFVVQKLYIYRDYTWHSKGNNKSNRFEYSLDQDSWFAGTERLVPAWNGFDNYNAVVINNHFSSQFFAFSIENPGCNLGSDSTFHNGTIWAR
jgi:hypothetical protein